MSSKFWFLPSGSDRQVEIDFGRVVDDIDGPYPVYEQTVQEAFSGATSTVTYSGRSQLTVRHTWTRGTRDASGDGDLLRRKLVTLASHLARGGSCTFAGHAEYARAGFCTQLPASQADTVHIDQDLFEILNPTANVVSGRELMVHGDHDRYLTEMKVCGTNSGKNFGLTQNIATDFTAERWVLVREYYAYPALRVPSPLRARADWVNHDREWKFSLELPLEEDPAGMESLWRLGMALSGSGAGPPPVTPTPSQLDTLPHYNLPGSGPGSAH